MMFYVRSMCRVRWTFVLLSFLVVWLFFLLRKQYISKQLAHKQHPGRIFQTDETMHLAMAACRGKSLTIVKEATTMIKSAIIFSRSRIHVHIFTENLEDEFRKETVLDKTDSVLYVDTDVIFLTPPEELWRHFYLFNDRQVAALAPRVGWSFQVPNDNANFIRMQDGKKTQVNSGVFLMNLTRMRQPVFATESESRQKISWNKKLLFPLYRKHKEDMYGDQNLINLVFHYNPDLIYFLPCKYNYHHKFCFDAYRERWCTSAESDGAAVIHGNANTFYNNYAPAFRAISNAMRAYNFERDLERYLLSPMESGLTDPSVEAHEHCGNKTYLFLKNIRKMVKRRRNFR
uniref:glucoside xylosyltransferase 1-like isoform X2 n=1 Tax=Ciona intestinalis TaxID=7719 RepID=UPI000EF4819B|nr:glucoside xylosyltransferase 1-like isoform X2 [Ciona intestinalis]|eukprot:XP_026692036.1 glucoside xylosyltransferase 1-like isoform X2 [Ciona intestinalis]